MGTTSYKSQTATFDLTAISNGWTGNSDSGTVGCVWHRLRLDADIPAGAQVMISYDAGDAGSPALPFQRSIIFTGKSAARDAYIEGTTGRYFTLRIEFAANADGQVPVLRTITVYYPRQTYMRFLPGIYAEDPAGKDVMERTLSLFESVLEKTSETIDALPTLFTPRTDLPPLSSVSDAGLREWLGWLSQWVSIDLYDQLQLNGNRKYVELASTFYRKKGTLDGLAELVTFLINPDLYTGPQASTGGQPTISCRIKEHKNILFKSWGLDHQDDFFADGQRGINECIPFFRRCSRTFNSGVNSANVSSYDDILHHVWGKNEHSKHFYARNVICLYIFLSTGSSIVSKEALLEIIRSYLPVFVEVEVVFVETSLEIYPPPPETVKDLFTDGLDDLHKDDDPLPHGVYTDGTNLQVLHANREAETTNSELYRIYHAGFDRQLDA